MRKEGFFFIVTVVLFMMTIIWLPNESQFFIIGKAGEKISKEDVCKLHGKVKVVESFPDYEVKIVDSFPDLKVKVVTSFPDKPGEWQFVESFPDFTVKFVDSFPDFTIKYVESFPGCD